MLNPYVKGTRSRAFIPYDWRAAIDVDAIADGRALRHAPRGRRV